MLMPRICAWFLPASGAPSAVEILGSMLSLWYSSLLAAEPSDVRYGVTVERRVGSTCKYARLHGISKLEFLEIQSFHDFYPATWRPFRLAYWFRMRLTWMFNMFNTTAAGLDGDLLESNATKCSLAYPL
ncbi:uncharacterized protein HD556DRAFT_1312963 [Suillus plorans]|uniref:Uncharacterized protein n=1 Tax=Suillus plorans TaxID=116603 RepID=A0A9P7DBC9_9AGAM|nr:uncharacterized protein HD556DRAFT_1312963 [Suillus plorans]KAG1787130.1 hypothetical protein HD556DRAFT_1312963 [Suillus plorans]